MYKIDHGMVDPGCKAILQASEAKLKEKRPVLLGHNMFHDLCFLHATFFGPLPDTLDEFGRVMHGLFPRIIDTKHILKRDDNEMMPSKGLDEMFVELERSTIPFIIDGERIGPAGKLHLVNEHQAGHDSYKTSVVFLKEMWKRVVDEKTQPGKSEPEKSQYSHQLLQWDSDVAQGFANKVRVGNAGFWDIGKSQA